ncbi:MAG: UDP-N-acetylmuramate dehydrogenase, partial [Parachlamydiaceae bacterium]
KSIEELKEAIAFAREKNLPYLVLGKGSNCLFHHEGYDGVVIQNKIDFFENPEPGVYRVGAGFSFALLGTKASQAGFSGLEFATGIPASVGGAIFMNAGANGSETKDSLSSVEFLNDEGKVIVLSKEELFFGYRTSSFQTMKGAILAATFKLTPSQMARQKQLEIISYRKKTQPYGDKSAGCVFRNPDCGHAGRLIEEAGLKGMKVGDAEVSTMHANFIVNKGNASSDDVLNLIEIVRKKVEEKAGVHLESEIRIIPKS